MFEAQRKSFTRQSTDYGPIDFVLTWVDDSDPTWRARKSRFQPSEAHYEATSAIRFRDWGLLRYWFRGIERFAPWVRQIFLITVNPVPEWLVKENPRLRIIRHEDFIPNNYLPTFNSRAIELNLHRLTGLSERFVYFNDDMFICSPVKETHFFDGQRPKLFPVETPIVKSDNLSHAMLNNLGVINRNFRKRTVIRRDWRKWLSPRNRMGLFQNLALSPWARFVGFRNHHLPMALKKSSYVELWNAEPELLHATSASRFRDFSNVNPFLLQWWLICSGDYALADKKNFGTFMQLKDMNQRRVVDLIRHGRSKLVCLNDDQVSDFENYSSALQEAFEQLLPTQSQFERHS